MLRVTTGVDRAPGSREDSAIPKFSQAAGQKVLRRANPSSVTCMPHAALPIQTHCVADFNAILLGNFGRHQSIGHAGQVLAWCIRRNVIVLSENELDGSKQRHAAQLTCMRVTGCSQSAGCFPFSLTLIALNRLISRASLTTAMSSTRSSMPSNRRMCVMIDKIRRW